MILKKIKLVNFRNYKKLNISFDKGINIIIGDNAQGKTNILESIYTLALTKSFRTTNDINLIRLGQDSFKIEGEIKNNKIPKKISLEMLKSKKYVKVNDNNISKISDYIGNLCIILSSPDDIHIIKGTPSERRNFLNTEISQLSSNYIKKYNEFNKILKMRNDYLKLIYTNSLADYRYLDILTDNLIEREIDIYIERYEFISKINERITDIFKSITALDNLKVIYENNVEFSNFSKETIKKNLKEKYQKNRDKEMVMGMTLYGPHRDDFSFEIDGNDIKNFGSQGQQKLAFLSLKFAEIKIFEDKTGTSPIILLDDIFSELDQKKINKIIGYIDDCYQVIITSNDTKGISRKLLNKSHIKEIKNGYLIEKE